MRQASIGDLVRRVASVEPSVLPRWMVSNDRYASRLDEREIRALAASALADGEDAAKGVQVNSSPAAIEGLASELGITVEKTDDEIDVAGHLFAADYLSNPPHIRLYKRALAAIDRGLSETQVTQTIGATHALPVLLAHEIYHHLDLIRPTTLTQRHRVTTLQLGPVHFRTELPSLAEVAAGSFAATLLGLHCHPKLLDLLLLWDSGPLRAHAWVDAVGAFALRLGQTESV